MQRDSLSNRVIHGVQWRFQARLVVVVLQLAVSIVLARILVPEDFGLVALAMIVIDFAEKFSSLGAGPAVIQMKDLTEGHVRTAYTISMLLGSAMTATIWLAAPVFGKLLGSKDVLPILRLTSMTFLLSAFGVVARSLLIRELNFKKIFFADVISNTGVGLFSILLALTGFGVWSLVLAGLAHALISGLIVLTMTRHSLIPRLRLHEASRLLSFGGLVSLNGVLNYGATRVDYFVVGRMLSAHALGLYSFIMRFLAMPLRYFSGILAEVLFPAFSEIQDQRHRLRYAYLLSVNITGLICFPFLAVMAIVAPEMIRGVFGPKWAGATSILQILCFGYALKTITRLAGPVAHATRNVHKESIRQFIYFFILSVSTVIGTRWGMEGVAVGVNIGSLFLFCMNGQLALRIVDSNWKEFLANLRPGLVLCIWVGTPLLAIRGILGSFYRILVPDLAVFLGMSLVGLALYFVAFVIVPVSWHGNGALWVFHELGLRLPLNGKRFLNRILGRVILSD